MCALRAIAVGMVLASCSAAGQEPMRWKLGPAFRQQLVEPVGLTWKDRGLRDGLVRLSETHGVSVFLDRRIDPDQQLTLTARDKPLGDLLAEIAAAAVAATTNLGSVVYIGPKSAAAQVATIAALRRQDAGRLPKEAQARVLKAQPWQSEELAQPRNILEELAQQASLRVVNAELIPLDVWPAVRVPPLAWTDRMTLLLIGFDLTFDFEEQGKTIRLVPAPAAAVIEKTHAVRGSVTHMASELRRVLPEVQTRIEQGKLVVLASEEDHDRIDRLLSGQSIPAKPKPGAAEKLYSMEVGNEPAGKVVKSIADSLGKELKYDAGVLKKLKQPIDLKLKDASLDFLLESTLKPLGLTYQLTEKALEIVPSN
jgi:hypothetical protein